MKANVKKTFGVFLTAVLAYGGYAALAPSTALACSCLPSCIICFFRGLECVCGGPCACCQCVVTF